jgi:hypothetical protein
LLLLFVIFELSFIFFSKSNSNSAGSVTVGRIKTLSVQISKIGPKATLEQLKNDISNVKSNTEQHMAVHEFGEALYNAEGYKGIVFCDNSFAYGCYHSFFSRAIADRGEAVVSLLSDECIKKYKANARNCIHGIGHGLLEYFGPQGLTKAVKECDALKIEKSLNGCFGGVFMEYFRPILINNGTVIFSVKKPDKNNLYDPCFSVLKDAQAPCFFHQAQWLYGSVLKSSKSVEDHCNKIPDAESRSACINGIGGALTANNGDNISKSVAECQKLSSEDDILNCIVGVNFELASIEKYRSLPQKVCNRLDTELKNKCLSIKLGVKN